MSLVTQGGCAFPPVSCQVKGREASSSHGPTQGRGHAEGLPPPRGTWYTQIKGDLPVPDSRKQ